MKRRDILRLSAVAVTGLVSPFASATVFGAEAAAGPAPADGLVDCPQCAGAGTTPCKAHCKDGKARCPGPCLKSDDPGLVKQHVDGHPDGQRWKTFPSRRPDHQGGGKWSEAHIGEVIVYENQVPVNKGRCPTCSGTGVVDCKICAGTGKQTCALCKGEKRVGKADAETFVKQQQAERNANLITLTDGRSLHGKIISRSTDLVIIKTEDGKMVSVKPTEIVGEPPVGGAPAPDAKNDGE